MIDAKAIVEEYTPHAYAVAFRLTGNRAEAWDLAQEAMLRVLKSFSTYDPAYKVEAWLARIVRNLYIDRIRQVSRRREDPLEDDSRAEDGRPTRLDSLADPGEAPDARADRDDRSAAVRRALMNLGEDMRTAVALVDLEGYSYEDAAKSLGITVSALGVRVFRGRKLLRERLRPYMEEGGMVRPPRGG